MVADRYMNPFSGARISPYRVLQSIDWEGEQELRELTILDALQCTLVRTGQGRQGQARMGNPSRKDHKLSGDVR